MRRGPWPGATERWAWLGLAGSVTGAADRALDTAQAHGFLLVQASFRFAKRAPPSYLEVAASFWEEPDEET